MHQAGRYTYCLVNVTDFWSPCHTMLPHRKGAYVVHVNLSVTGLLPDIA